MVLYLVSNQGKQSNTGHTLQKTSNPKSAEHTHTEEPSLTRHYYFLSNIAVNRI